MERFNSGFSIGKKHVKDGWLCQDRAIAVKDKDMIILALSDGMGAWRHSELGAIFATYYIRENAGRFYELLNFSESEDKKVVWSKGGDVNFSAGIIALLREMESSAKKYAHNIGIDIAELNCTLSFSIIGPEKVLNVAIGDSPLYLSTDAGVIFIDGDNASTFYVTSAIDSERAIRNMGLQAGFTKYLKSVLMTSDGCLGYSKETHSQKNLPKWYYDMIRGNLSVEETLSKLVDDGYDDCAFAYYDGERRNEIRE